MLGEIVNVSEPCTAPERITIRGTRIELVPWGPEHTEAIWPYLEGPQNESIWTYWPAGPYPTLKAFSDDFSFVYDKTDPLFWAIIELKSGKCLGQAILGEVDVDHRNIESGMFLTLPLQKTAAATEAFYLIARLAFSLGFRRLAWKTSSLNMPSRRAAERYGFTHEGIWRQHKIEKERNRDSAWYAIIDKEWPVRQLAFEKWLQPDNFDANGKQKVDLVSIRKQLEANGGA